MRIMKVTILFVALIILLTLALQAQSQNKTSNQNKTQTKNTPATQEIFNPKAIIDSVLVKAEAISLNSADVLWDSVRKQMYAKAFDAKSVYELQKSFEHLLFSLRDHDGVIHDPATNTHIAVYPGEKPREELREHPEFQYAILEHNVRYIRLIAVPSGDVQEQAQKIRVAVDSLLKSDEVHHWIVDLRYCSGGDMKSLLAGLSPILDEGLIATTVNNRGKIQDMYTVHNGNVYLNQVRVGKFAPHPIDLKNAKIAVLTSHYTSGAAEILSIALQGKRHTKFFGEPTAGNVFGIASIPVHKNVLLQLTNTMFVNRKGIEYRHPIMPDTTIPYTTTDLEHDEAVKEASSWLKSHESAAASKVAAN
jgi:carboxyl-terminal processing protease